jgi:hypothetical protein
MAHQPFDRIGDNDVAVPYGSKGQPTANCARAGYNQEWADYKTSVLIQELSVSQSSHIRLLQFLTNIGTRLCNKIGLDLNQEIQTYIQVMVDPIQYPVGQNTLGEMRNTRAVSSDFYAFMNVLKNIWIKIHDNNIPDHSVVYYNMINIIQQNVSFNLLGNFRGRRYDRNQGFTAAEQADNQVGITNIRDPFLVRNLRHLGVLAQPRGWIHPGEARCRLPYRGKYGKLIRENTEQNGFFGSYKCGISGSVNYLLYLYLMSIHGNNQGDFEGSMNDLIDNLILSCCLYLAGDGGHTIREIFYALILCFSLLDRLRIEYENIDLPENVRQVYQTFFTGNVTRFITAFCDRFAHINITGVVEADFPAGVLHHIDGLFRAYTTILIRSMCYGQYPPDLLEDRFNSWGYIQMYLALDRNRYRQDNFLYAASQTIGEIVTRVDGDIINRVNTRLQAKFGVCGVAEMAHFVPFSFNSKNSKNASKKKSVSKKKSTPKKKKSVSKKKSTPTKTKKR